MNVYWCLAMTKEISCKTETCSSYWIYISVECAFKFEITDFIWLKHEDIDNLKNPVAYMNSVTCSNFSAWMIWNLFGILCHIGNQTKVICPNFQLLNWRSHPGYCLHQSPHQSWTKIQKSHWMFILLCHYCVGQIK